MTSGCAVATGTVAELMALAVVLAGSVLEDRAVERAERGGFWGAMGGCQTPAGRAERGEGRACRTWTAMRAEGVPLLRSASAAAALFPPAHSWLKALGMHIARSLLG